MRPPVLAELRIWQRIRRYAVPPAMITACTAAREAGDWRAACAAGRIDIAFDLAQVSRKHGREQAERIEADLAVLAPDLLRWHLPRTLGGRTSLATHQQFLLSTSEGRFGEDDVALVLQTPKTVDGSQRMRLTVRPVIESPSRRSDLPPVFWSAAHVSGLPAAYGGSNHRLPGFEPDGSVRPFDAYARTIDPADPASRVEVFDRLVALGELYWAWDAAGVELEPPESGRHWHKEVEVQSSRTLLPVGLDAELARLQHRYGLFRWMLGDRWRLIADVRRYDDGPVTASFPERSQESFRLPRLATIVHSRPVDLELVRHGLLAPAELHPLVRRALFPATPAGPANRVDRPELQVSVPVRCRGEWHSVVHGDGRLELTSHTADEISREELLRTLGGQVAGCFAVRQAWRGSGDRLPRRLRELRRDVLLRIQHGGSAALTELLDAGLDPRIGDGRGGTLLHHLRAVHDVKLVRRLVDAGVPVDAANRRGRTALHVAVDGGGSPEMVRALIEAGADPQVRDDYDQTVVEVAEYKAELSEERDANDAEELQKSRRIRDLVNGRPCPDTARMVLEL